MLQQSKKTGGVSVRTQVRRLRRFIEIIQEGAISISDLRIDEKERKDTVRKDVLNIQKESNLIRYFDDETIISFPFVPEDTEFLSEIDRHLFEKRAIARYIIGSKLIDYGDIIFLDSGTTTFQIAVELSRSPYTDIVVVTNNAYVLPCLSRKIQELRLIAGLLSRERSVLLKSPAYDFEKEEIKKSFISLTGLSYDQGVFCEARLVDTKREIVLATEGLVVFVTDHSKIGKTSGQCFISFEELEKGDKNYCVVTDSHFPDEESRSLFDTEREKFPIEKFTVVAVPRAEGF